ncbi:MAG: DinB family protein [Saprospiraceae bacterium]|nr:DinB family protein [Saprospiraceae bacterium]|tara:strand:+ start:573 stop:1094 length:522 start_codon:yes stop_codon:yes gene_type:complete
MNFDLKKSIEILQRTPIVIESLLSGLSDDWLKNNEGENTWSPYEILGHLIHGEKTDWITRSKIIISNSSNKTFEPFDRFAQENEDSERPINKLIEEFKNLRDYNLKELENLQINSSILIEKGIHPELGDVSLKELLASWVVHDLGHISQISRVMAKQYKAEVGPWIAFLGILK